MLSCAIEVPIAGGASEHHSGIEITWHIPKPVELPPPGVSQLHVLTGIRIQEFAENAGKPDAGRKPGGTAEALFLQTLADSCPNVAEVMTWNTSGSGLHG